MRKIRDINLLKYHFTNKHLPILLWIIQLSCCILYIPGSNAQSLNTGDTTRKAAHLDTFRISGDAIDAIIEYKAEDSTYFDLKKKKAYLYGNAQVKYDGMDLKAALIVVDFERRELYAKGRIDSNGRYVDLPVFKDEERETQADTMIYNFETKRGRTYGIAMKQDEFYIYCNTVLRDDDKSIYSDKGRYTTCNNKEHPHFYLSTTNLKIIPDKKIIFGPSYMVVEDIPTPLMIPFGMVPTNKEKRNGLTRFEYGMSGNYGPFLRNVGYQFGIGDKFDQVIAGDIYFRGSWKIASNSRYISRYKHNGNVSLEFAKFQNGEKEDPDYKTNFQRTARIIWNHTQDPRAKPGSSFTAKVDIQKNKAAQLTSYNPSAIISNEFQSSISYSKKLLNNKAELRLTGSHRQNTQNGMFTLELPGVNFNLFRIMPFSEPGKDGKYKWYKDFGFSYSLDMSNQVNTKDTIFFSGKPLESLIPSLHFNSPIVLTENDKFKQGILHNIPITLGSYKFFKNYFTFSPSVTYREFWYFKTIEKYWDQSDSTVKIIYNNGFSRASDYSASGNLSTNIFGTYQLSSKKVSAVRHTINPSLNFSYRPDYSKSNFGYYKEVQVDTSRKMQQYSIYEGGIKGRPDAGRSGMIGFAINNNLQAKVLKKTDSSTQYQNITWIEGFNITGSYNALADSQKLSNISVNAFTKLFNKININSTAVLNPYQKHGNTYINKFQLAQDGRIGTWTYATMQVGTAIDADMFRKKKSLDTAGKIKSKEDLNEYNQIRRDPDGYVNFNLPWNFNINYSVTYTRSNYVTNVQQTFGITGGFNLTPKWKISTMTGYDFKNKKISYTQFEVSRTLHCWGIYFTWIPDGLRKSFTFSLRANSSVLQSLKVEKRRNWWDQ